MSTMYEALKKAEAERKMMNQASPGAPAGSPDSSARTLVIALAVIFIGLVGWNIYRFQGAASVKKPAPVKAEVQQQVSLAAAQSAAAAPTAEGSKYPPGTYVLDGIICAGDNSVAVINGKVLLAGEKIDALMVQKISAQEVELLNTKDNTPLILHLH